MKKSEPRYDKDEFARRGDDIYERQIKPVIEAGNEGKYVAIDIESGDYEVDVDELVATDRLSARHADAQVWLRRIGPRFARRF